MSLRSNKLRLVVVFAVLIGLSLPQHVLAGNHTRNFMTGLKEISQKENRVKGLGKNLKTLQAQKPVASKNGNLGLTGLGKPQKKVIPFPNGNTGISGLGMPLKKVSEKNAELGKTQQKIIPFPNGNTGISGLGMPLKKVSEKNAELGKTQQKVIPFPNGNTGISGLGMPTNDSKKHPKHPGDKKKRKDGKDPGKKHTGSNKGQSGNNGTEDGDSTAEIGATAGFPILTALISTLGQGSSGGGDSAAGGSDTQASFDNSASYESASYQPASEPASYQAASYQAGAPAAEEETGSVDLVLEDVTLAANATVVAGPAYAVRFRNQGTAASGKFLVAAIASIDGKATKGAPYAAMEVSSLAPGETRELALRLPATAMKMAAGGSAFSHLIVAVDATDAVGELDENNNAAVLERAALEVAAE